ncbi:MAG TPA: RraA family protein [Actinomycetota bacterium]|nr:RraA family protein [Actinomycetota bacterium]
MTAISDLALLTSPALADACMRVGVEIRSAPSGVQQLLPGTKAAGPVLPVRHAGSVDIFFEAYEQSQGGEVLVIDNQGRTDEGCVGDLTVIEAREAGLSGVVVWGCHRDTDELLALGLPVFSYGRVPLGPREARPRPPDALTSARFGPFSVTANDAVLADADGAMFVPLARLEELVETGRTIIERERAQADRAAEGASLREQMRFADYLSRRARDPSYTFREHLREVGSEIEE